MAILILLLGLFLFSGSDSFAQVYKYVDKEGKICFTDNPTSSILKDSDSNKGEKTQKVVNQKKRVGSDLKDIRELGHEMLKEELAKPPKKQNRRLIQELTEILYGEGPGRKLKNARD